MATNNKTTSTLSMLDSPESFAVPQYARPPNLATRAGRKQVVILGGLLQLLLIPAFVSLGLWQWNKAESKTALQASLDTRSQDVTIAMPTKPADVEALRHRRVLLDRKSVV